MPLDAIFTKIEERLGKLEAKPSSPGVVRELLARLDTKIREAQEKGYSTGEIVELIVSCGFDANPNDLKKQLVQALEQKRKRPRSKPTKSVASKSST